MASPDAAAPTGSRVTRASAAHASNSLRRTIPKRKIRTSNDAAETTTKAPARKRSRIQDDAVNGTGTVNGDEVANGSVNGSGGAGAGAVRRVSQHSVMTSRLAVKRASSSSYRLARTESAGHNTLSKTAQYTIRQLPGLPDSLRNSTHPFRAFFQSLSPHTHDVILTTASNIYIWNYDTTITSPVPYTVRLPEPLKSTSDKLPLAAVVPNGAAVTTTTTTTTSSSSSSSSKDTGLVVVYPSSGKVWYWPQSDSATSYTMYSRALDKFEGAVKLMSGEVVERLVKVEHGGFVLVLSSGRLAYLGLQDRNSRPGVHVQIFSNESQTSRGFFGSLRGVLGGGWRNTVAGVRTRTKNHRFETVALTQEGVLKVWDVEYDGTASFMEQYNLAEHLRSAYVDVGLVDDVEKKPSITFVDFALPKRSSSSSALTRHGGDEVALDLIALVAIADADEKKTNFQLAHASIAGKKVEFTRFTPIHVFAPETFKPEVVDLVVPDPGHSAFIVTPGAVILVSLERVYSNARDELKQPVFQDVIYFQYKLGTEIVSSAPEFHGNTGVKSDASGLLLFTKSSGAVRIAAERPSKDPKRQTIGPKPKIEQEVFFGKHAQPILDFGQRAGFKFPQKDVEDAALQLSAEILTSSNPNIPDGLSSMETQIHARKEQLQRLIDFVLSKFSPISRATRWRLLWDAEKLEAAGRLWKVYEQWLEKEKDDEKLLLPLFIQSIPEKDRTPVDAVDGHSPDIVRHWFAHDVDRIGKIMNHIETVILSEHKLQKGNWGLLVQYIQEAQDIITALLSTAYEFRTKSLETYGLQDEPIKDGVLTTIDAYTDLQEPWTATRNICSHLEGNVTATTRLLVNLTEETLDEASKIDTDTLTYLRKHQWALVLITCLAHAERGRWTQSRTDEETRAAGAATLKTFERDLRPEMLLGLAELGRASDGMRIAEKVGDLSSLVQLCLAELEYLADPEETTHLDPKEHKANETKRKDLYTKLNTYFTTYGEDFARRFFTAQVDSGRLADLLQVDFGKGKQLTAYLRENGERWTKFSWINEVLREKDLQRAGETLLHLAYEKEQNVWAKDRELGLAKLMYIAAENKPRSSLTTVNGTSGQADGANAALTDIQRAHILVDLQKSVRRHLMPTFQLGTTSDDGVELAMREFGTNTVRNRPRNAVILRECIEKIKRVADLSPEMLIDAFTLMDDGVSEDAKANLKGKLFLCAIKALYASGLFERRDGAEQGERLRNLIWKRVLVRDDWVAIQQTKGKRDKQVEAKLRQTGLFETLRLGGLENLWDTHPAYTIPTPADVLEALSNPAHLLPRFGDNADLAKGIATDNALDDDLLNDYLSRCKLGSHFEACRALANDAVEDSKKEKEAREEARREAVLALKEREVQTVGVGRGGLVGRLGGEEVWDVLGEDEGEDVDADVDIEVDGGEEILTQEQIDFMEE